MKPATPLTLLLLLSALAAAPSSAETPDAVEFLPDSVADAFIMGAIDARTIAQQGGLDFAKKLLPAIMKQAKLDEVFNEFGFDIKTDLHSIAYAVRGDLEDGPDGVVVVATGNFKKPAILEALKKRAKLKQLGEFDVLPVDDEVAFAPLSDTVAVFGTEQHVLEVIERFNNPGRGESKAVERLKHHTGDFSLQVNPAKLPEDLWKVTQMFGVGQENVVSAGVAGKVKTATRLHLNMKAKAVFATPDGALQVHEKIVKVIDDEQKIDPLLQVIFDEIALAQDGDTITAQPTAGLDKTAYLTQIGGVVMVMRIIRAFRNIHWGGVRQDAVDPGDPEELSACELNLQRIAIALHVHAAEQADKAYPSSLKEMVDNGVLFDMNMLICPADRTAFTPGEFYTSYETLFELTVKRIPQDSIPQDTIVIWDKQPHHGNGRNVLFANAAENFLRKVRKTSQIVVQRRNCRSYPLRFLCVLSVSVVKQIFHLTYTQSDCIISLSAERKFTPEDILK